MNIKDLIIKEMKRSSSWTRYLLKEFDRENEFTIPDGIKANVNWQIGHILLSRHFHSVVCVFGKQEELMEKIPFREYAGYYAMGSQPIDHKDKKPNIDKMIDDLRMVDETAIKLIEAMDESEFDQDPLRTHPVAKTKLESLMWSSQHQMWHNGQLAMIKNLF